MRFLEIDVSDGVVEVEAVDDDGGGHFFLVGGGYD